MFKLLLFNPPTRWTSHRNSSWFLTHLFSREQRLEFIAKIVSEFLDELMTDIDEMEVNTNERTDQMDGRTDRQNEQYLL